MPERSSEVARSQIARANGIRLRNLLLAHERWLTSEQVAALMHTDADPEAYTKDLRARRMLMGARYQQQYLHPAVQFDATGRTLTRLQELLAVLPNSGSGWTSMFWFFQPTGRLNVRRPADLFAIAPEAVIAAARADFEGGLNDW